MKKFFILVFVLIFALLSFTGCKTSSIVETNETPMPENGIVVTPDPIEETNEAEQALIEVLTNVPETK